MCEGDTFSLNGRKLVQAGGACGVIKVDQFAGGGILH